MPSLGTLLVTGKTTKVKTNSENCQRKSRPPVQVKVPDWPPVLEQQNCEQELEPKTVYPDEMAIPLTAVCQLYKAWEVYTETFPTPYTLICVMVS